MTPDERLRAAINGVRGAVSDIRKAQSRMSNVMMMPELELALRELKYTEETLVRGLRPDAPGDATSSPPVA